MTQCHLPLAAAVVATDQSKLPKDNGSQSLHKVMGSNGPDQSNVDDGCHRMDGGMTWTASRSQKTMHVSRDGTRTMIKLDHNATG